MRHKFYSTMWHSLAAFILKQRFTLLALLLAITVYMGIEASKVTLSYDFTSAIPTNNPNTSPIISLHF